MQLTPEALERLAAALPAGTASTTETAELIVTVTSVSQMAERAVGVATALARLAGSAET